MLLILIHAVAVSASVEVLLPRLVMSSRVVRGYAFQDKVTRAKHIGTSVDSIPYLAENLLIAMKATMIAYQDIADEMRKLHALFAKLWSLEFKKSPADQSLTKKVHATIVSVPKEVSRIVKDAIAANSKIRKCDDALETKLADLVRVMKRSIQAVLASLDSLARRLTGDRVVALHDAMRDLSVEQVFSRLADNIRSAIATLNLSPAMNYMLIAKIDAVISVSHLNNTLIKRLYHRLYCNSILVRTCGMEKVSVSRLQRILTLYKAASVTRDFANYHCYPVLNLPQDESLIPNHDVSFQEIMEKTTHLHAMTKTFDKAKRQLIEAAKAAAYAGSSTAFATVAETVQVQLDLLRRQDALWIEVHELTQKHLWKGYEYYICKTAD